MAAALKILVDPEPRREIDMPVSLSERMNRPARPLPPHQRQTLLTDLFPWQKNGVQFQRP